MKKLFAAVISLVIIIGILWIYFEVDYNSYRYVFRGQGNDYTATLDVKGREVWYKFNGRLYHMTDGESMFEMVYKGSQDQLQGIEKIEYIFDLGTKKGSGTINDPFSLKILTSKSPGFINEKSLIESDKNITMNTDGAEEKFELIRE